MSPAPDADLTQVRFAPLDDEDGPVVALPKRAVVGSRTLFLPSQIAIWAVWDFILSSTGIIASLRSASWAIQPGESAHRARRYRFDRVRR